jgi:glutamate synthase (NADPH/NADH) large chain
VKAAKTPSASSRSTRTRNCPTYLGKGRIERDLTLKAGDSLRSAIKQVASGRFGVTAEYLVNADQIQIKMAQGAKPGEGGQLPGHKVSEYIGFLRHSVPGVGLISPPPHHDIYSIEDLAQLIHDLKNANPAASVSVKLVSEVGVGTVAAGVSKAKADHVVIAGHDGGTGASPLSSIKHAGAPWELGLAETQQTLVLNQLRSRIRVQVDGQLKYRPRRRHRRAAGRGRVRLRHRPAGGGRLHHDAQVPPQHLSGGRGHARPELRKRFTGQPEHVVNFFFFIAEEVREIMASLGVRTFDDLVGRADLLDTKCRHQPLEGTGPGLLEGLLPAVRPRLRAAQAHRDPGPRHRQGAGPPVHRAGATGPARHGKKVTIELPIRNVNRTAGTMLSGEVAKRYGHAGLPDDTIHLKLNGTAGQSFGAFLAKGITLELVGEGNDYVGKGLSGGRIIIRPHADFRGDTSKNIILGNTVMYGATEGEGFFTGVAGERFAVRNSGGTAVVEGVGDHGCEYMTGGTVVVLGNTGRNFAAGMSGGIAYVYDANGAFKDRCNLAQVALEKVVATDLARGPSPATSSSPTAGAPLHRGHEGRGAAEGPDQRHAAYTGSATAKAILANWDESRDKFVKVYPHEYKRALTELAAQQQKEVA